VRGAALLASALACSGCQAVAYRSHDPATGHDVEIVGSCGEEFVRVAGVEHPSFARITRATLTIADERVAYAAEDDDGTFLVVDGRPVAGPFASITELQPSPRPSTWVAVELDGGRARVHRIDARATVAGSWFDGVLAGSLTLGARGEVAYVGARGAEQCVVADGAVVGCFDGVASLQWDARQLSFFARRGDATYVVRGDRTFGPYEDVAWLGPSGRASGSLALVRDADAWFVDDGATRSAPFDRIGEVQGGGLATGARTVFWATRGRQAFVVDDGVEHGPFAEVDPTSVAIGADGATVTYVVREDGRERLFVDHRPHAPAEPYGAVEEVTVGPDSRVGFVARDGDASVVVIDQHVMGSWSRASSLTLVAPGRDWVLARARGVDVVVEGGHEREVGAALADTFVVSEDRRSWAVASVGDDGLVWFGSRGRGPAKVDLEEIVGDVLRKGEGEGEGDGARALRAWLLRSLRASE
jgi:hypothetical protein